MKPSACGPAKRGSTAISCSCLGRSPARSNKRLFEIGGPARRDRGQGRRRSRSARSRAGTSRCDPFAETTFASPPTPLRAPAPMARRLRSREFVGAEALRARKAAGAAVRLTCFTAEGPVPRRATRPARGRRGRRSARGLRLPDARAHRRVRLDLAPLRPPSPEHDRDGASGAAVDPHLPRVPRPQPEPPDPTAPRAHLRNARAAPMNPSAELSVEASRCIRCGACRALCPGVFDLIDGSARAVRKPEAGERAFAEAARWICPVDAIRRSGSATAGARDVALRRGALRGARDGRRARPLVARRDPVARRRPRASAAGAPIDRSRDGVLRERHLLGDPALPRDVLRRPRLLEMDRRLVLRRDASPARPRRVAPPSRRARLARFRGERPGIHALHALDAQDPRHQHRLGDHRCPRVSMSRRDFSRTHPRQRRLEDRRRRGAYFTPPRSSGSPDARARHPIRRHRAPRSRSRSRGAPGLARRRPDGDDAPGRGDDRAPRPIGDRLRVPRPRLRGGPHPHRPRRWPALESAAPARRRCRPRAQGAAQPARQRKTIGRRQVFSLGALGLGALALEGCGAGPMPRTRSHPRPG